MGERQVLPFMRHPVAEVTCSVAEAAQWLRVDRDQLERAAVAHQVPTIVLRGVHRLPMSWVERAKTLGWMPTDRPASRPLTVPPT